MQPQPPAPEKHKVPMHKFFLVLWGLVTILLIVFVAYLLGRQSADPIIYIPGDQPSPTITEFQYPNISKVPRPTSFVTIAPEKPTSSIPASVESKFVEVDAIYGASAEYPGLGAGIQYCEKGSSQLYVVWGSGGYTGENHYYEKNGTYLGKSTFSDTPPFNGNEDLDININEYGCIDLKTSNPSSGTNLQCPGNQVKVCEGGLCDCQ